MERQERRRQAERRNRSATTGSGRALTLHGLTPIRIGTCSWADEALSKYFYPPKLPAKERLAYYAQFFDTVEVDSTYYRLPGESMVQGWADRTPDGFTMHVKAFGLMTRHPVKIEVLPEDLRDAMPVDERGRVDRPPRELRGEVFRRFLEALEPLRSDRQARRHPLPVPAVRRLQGSLARVSRVGDASSSAATRCSSSSATARGSTRRTARRRSRSSSDIGAAYVTVDAPKSDTAKNLVPTVPAVTSGTAYVRFHGRNLGTWNKRGGSAAERFDYLYSDEELDEWYRHAEGARAAVGAGVRVLQQQLDVGGSREPARPHLAGGDERAPAAAAARRQPDPGDGRRRRRIRAMHVLSVIHGTDARTELFAPAIADAGHALDEWSFGWGTPPPRPLDSYDAVLVFGGAMHADQDDHHPWLARGDDVAAAAARDRHTPVLGVCLGVQLLARAAGAWVGRMPAGPEIGWCDVELTDAGVEDPGARRDAADVRGAAVAPLHVRRAGRRRRARAQRRVHAGVPARRRVLGRAVPSRGDGGAARGLDRRRRRIRRPIPTRLRAEIPQKIGAGTTSGGRSAPRFLLLRNGCWRARLSRAVRTIPRTIATAQASPTMAQTSGSANDMPLQRTGQSMVRYLRSLTGS